MTPVGKPWDARIASYLVRPLCKTFVTPNHLTTVRLLTGLVGVYLLTRGDAFNAGAWIIVVSNFLDHTDGELARLTGKASAMGHHYDVASDALITVGLFVGLGINVYFH